MTTLLASPTFRFALLLVGLAAAPAFAQADAPLGRLGRSETMRSTAPGYYVYHQPGEATVQVAVEGAVRSPGLYEVALGTDLQRVLALAGGPAYDAREANVRQRVEVRLFRPERGVVFASQIQNVAVAPGATPELREGDSILVDVIRRRSFGWQDAAGVIGALSGVAVLISVLAN